MKKIASMNKREILSALNKISELQNKLILRLKKTSGEFGSGMGRGMGRSEISPQKETDFYKEYKEYNPDYSKARETSRLAEEFAASMTQEAKQRIMESMNEAGKAEAKNTEMEERQERLKERKQEMEEVAQAAKPKERFRDVTESGSEASPFVGSQSTPTPQSKPPSSGSGLTPGRQALEDIVKSFGKDSAWIDEAERKMREQEYEKELAKARNVFKQTATSLGQDDAWVEEMAKFHVNQLMSKRKK